MPDTSAAPLALPLTIPRPVNRVAIARYQRGTNRPETAVSTAFTVEVNNVGQWIMSRM